MTRIASHCCAAATGLGIIGLAVIAAAATPPPVRIEVGTASGGQGARVALSVRLRTNTDVVATANILTLPPPLRVHWDGGPACEGAPDLPAASFVYHPEGCAPWLDCAGVRVRVMDLGPVVPIPDGAVLYTCTIDFGDAPPGVYPIGIESPMAVDANGIALQVVGQAGTLTVDEGFATRVEAPTVSGLPGTRHRLDVVLRTDVEVVGTDNIITFSPQTPIAARDNGRPACTRPADRPGPIGYSFTFLPRDCLPGVTCNAIRALVLALDAVIEIPDRSVLYSCELDIAAGATPGVYPLTVSNVGASDPDGGTLLVGGTDGAVIVEAPTPTPTETPLPPTATPSGTATAPPTLTPARRMDSDGCAVAAPDGQSVWWCLLPLLFVRVRRAR